MIIPSSTEWGSPSMMLRSLKAPGSPSSPLQMTILSGDSAPLQERHLRAVAKQAPHLPRSPQASTSAMTCSGLISNSALANPPLAP